MATWENWSGHLQCTPTEQHQPQTVDQLRALIATAEKVRLVGSGHSFTELVPTEHTLVSLDRLTGLNGVDTMTGRATVAAGTIIHALGPLLAAEGLALANQGDIDCQALAGAVATGTHGTGASLGCIASRVTGFKMVTASGQLVSASPTENPELLSAGCVSLGTLGAFAEIEIECDSVYNLEERVWVEPIDQLLERWHDLRDGHRHFEFFVFPYTGLALAKTLDLAPATTGDSGPSTAADSSGGAFTHSLELNRTDPQQARQLFADALAKTSPTEASGRSHEIFPSERTDLFNEMEYAVPIERGVQCMREVHAAIEAADLGVIFPFEFRTVAADDLWLSPFYQRDSAVIAVHQDAALGFAPVFAVAEPILQRHGGRAHWGKIHTLGPDELTHLYPRFEDFVRLRRELDPEGKFLNHYLARLFGEAA